MDIVLKKLISRPVAAVVAALLLAVGAAGHAAAPPAAGARAVVEEFHGKLMDVMKSAKTLGMEGRFARLEPEIARHFNIPLMVALTTGKHWREAPPEDRRRLIDAFKRFSAATYASRFSDFSGESFETVQIQPGPRQTQLVRTRINRPDDSPVTITYVTRPADSSWQIVDMLVDDGISELAVRRSEYRSVLSSSGVDGLVRLLDRKTEQLLAK